MKVMIKLLIFDVYPLEIYGNQKYILLILKFLDKNRVKPLLATTMDGKLPNKIRETGHENIIIPPPKRLTKFGGSLLYNNLVDKLLTGIALVRYNLKLAKLLKNRNIDLIYCNNLRSLLCIGLAAKLCRIPCIWYIKGESDSRILDRLGFIIADKILFIAESLKQVEYPVLMGKYTHKIDVLKIGVDLENINSSMKRNSGVIKQELKIRDENINIVTVGQLSPQKGIDYLLEAFRNTKEVFPNIMLLVVGHFVSHEYKNKLFNLVKKYKLDDNVIFTGWRDDSINIVSYMHIFVSASLSEGVPRSIIEAMALGKPVVATDVGGVSETVIVGETGFVVKPAEPKALSDAIIKLIKDENLRKKFGEKAKEIAFKEYSIRTHMANLEKIYKNLLMNRK